MAAPDPVTTANRLLQSGNFGAASSAYATLAADKNDARYRALSILAAQDAGEHEGADQLLGENTDDTGEPLLDLAKACSLLRTGFATDAYALATRIDARRLSGYARGKHARCLGEAAYQTGEYPVAAPLLSASFSSPYPAAERDRLNDMTFEALSRLSRGELSAPGVRGDAVQAGWYALAEIASRTMFETARFSEETTAWSTQYPGHPAAAMLERLVERSEALSVRPRQVALLLPFDDNLGAAAAAIRDGFLTAWYRDNGNPTRPSVMVYSTAGDDGLAATVNRAVAEGAEFIVGPLRKKQVETLRDAIPLDQGVLALNVATGDSARHGFYQFGLSPEHEASQTARRARQSGQRALILTPDTTWGQRLFVSFRDMWHALDGEVVAHVAYGGEAEAYSGAVKRALNIDRSELRHAELRRTIGRALEFEPRRRTDVDLILLAGFPSDATQILPQLRYFRAESIPVFATSHVYGGGTRVSRDPDLNGVTFGDMPWLFGLADRDSFNLVRRNWQDEADRYARLYGFGIDAYRLMPYLAKMRLQPGLRIPGVTGDLWMDSDGIVHRNMTWLKVVDGIPTVVDTRSDINTIR